MKRVLITGKNSYIGISVEKWLNHEPKKYKVDTISTFDDEWKTACFSQYDVVFHVAGIAHVDAKKSMADLYYKVNRDLTIEVAKAAKACGVKQFIFMSSMIVYHESKSLRAEMITEKTRPKPNGFYGNSKLQAEEGLHDLEDDTFKVVILRPPMIYGPNSKGNFTRLVWLATKTPIFPAFHNQRSMLYVGNLCEFVKKSIDLELSGTYYPQNKELADTVEIIQYFSKKMGHRVHIWRWLNLFVYLGSPFVNALNKMFATYYYDPQMSKTDFLYQIYDQERSFDLMIEGQPKK